MPSLLCLLCLAAAPLRVQTEAVGLSLVDGTVTELDNRLTGERLAGPGAPLLGLWRRLTDGGFAFEPGEQSAAGRLTTEIAARGEAVTITQRATGPAGLRGAQWGVSLPPDAVVLVPGHSGLRLDGGSPVTQMTFDYPITWECQFIIIETPRGGLLIRCEDDAQVFKRLEYRRATDGTRLTFETQAGAPWQAATEVPATTWVIEAFAGDWTVGAARYRAWARERFGLTEVAAQQPAWAGEVQFMVISGLAPALLDALAERVEPSQTIIYVPSWRVDSYDRNYPDYTPAPGFAEQVSEAQRRGFRVMLHVNYFGCTPENPTYAAMEPYHTRNPYSGQLEYWNWTRATPPIKFAYINPAAQAWRDLFCDRMAELIERTGADSLHLDQTLCIYNDANGLIDGLNMMQGNLALHQELRRRLPEVALSGEGLNEISCRYEAFAQRHLYGLNHADGTWSNELIALAHPIASAVLRPYTKMVGYLGYTSPNNEDLFLAWQAGYERFGIIPTLAHTGAGELRSGTVGLEQELRRAVDHQRLGLEPDFDTAHGDRLFLYRTRDGELWERRREPSGSALVDHTGQVVERRLAGVAEARIPGSVPGAVAYDEERVFGLDPGRAYYWSATPRDAAAPHVTACRPELPLSGRLAADGLSIIGLADPFARPLLAQAREVRCGVRSAGGVAWQDGAALQHESGAQVRPESNGLFVHPPWHGPAAGGALHGQGHVLLELTLDLPAEPPLSFEASVGLRPEAPADQTDGLTGIVTAAAGEQVLRTEVHAPAGPRAPLSLDLAPLAGRTIRLTLETTPGPAGNPSFDWGIWERPRLVSLGGTPTELELHLPTLPAAAVSAAGAVLRELGGGRYATVARAPGRLYLMAEPPRAVAAGESLLTASWLPVLEHGGAFGTAGGYSVPAPGEAAVGGESRPALHAHPPNNGRLELHLPLRLPGGRLRLVGAAGIRDGNESEGVGFTVAVNDRVLWQWTAEPPLAGWHPFAVELGGDAGGTVVLSLITDSLGAYNFDWAVWSDLRLEGVGE